MNHLSINNKHSRCISPCYHQDRFIAWPDGRTDWRSDMRTHSRYNFI